MPYSEILPESDIHIGREIRHVMTARHITASWLAGRLFCDRTNVYKLFRRKSVDTETLFKISVLLRHDFFAVYSGAFRRLSEEFEENT